MGKIVDLRPPGLDLLFRPNTTLRIDLVWPEGSLAGRTFSSTLDGVPIALAVNGDTITIDVTAAQTGAHPVGAPVEWALDENIAGADQRIISGSWTPSTSPRAIRSATVPVSLGAVEAEVTVHSAPASIAALQAELAGAHILLELGTGRGTEGGLVDTWYWQFSGDFASEEDLIPFEIPAGWSTARVVLVWYHPGPDVTGGPLMALELKDLAEGDLVTDPFDVTQIKTFAAAPENAVVRSEFDPVAVTPGNVFTGSISRGDDGLDDPVRLLAIRFERVS
jgi:hypothetical protein